MINWQLLVLIMYVFLWCWKTVKPTSLINLDQVDAHVWQDMNKYWLYIIRVKLKRIHFQSFKVITAWNYTDWKSTSVQYWIRLSPFEMDKLFDYIYISETWNEMHLNKYATIYMYLHLHEVKYFFFSHVISSMKVCHRVQVSNMACGILP